MAAAKPDHVAAVTYDEDDDSVVVVIGSGAGGGTMAHELCARGIAVVLLEAGPRIEMDAFLNDEWAAYEQLTWTDKRTISGTSPAAILFPETPSWVVKAVGGSTTHWGGVCLRIQAHEFKALSTYGAIKGANLLDWPVSAEEMAPYYDRAEAKMGVSGTQGISPLPANNNYKIFAAGARRVGYRHVDHGNLAINPVPRDGRNGCDAIGFCFQGCKSGAKWSTLYAEIPKAEATGNCELRTECMALRIVHDECGHASGVEYADRDGHRHLQKARVVCVAGNAIETTRLLLNSETSRFPDGLANLSGELGRNYMRHMSGFLWARFARPIHMNRGTVVCGLARDEAKHEPSRGFAGGIYMMTEALGLPYFAAFSKPTGWGSSITQDIEHYAHTTGCWFCGEDMPQASNTITLDPSEKDRFGLPIPHVHVDDHPNELAMKNYGFKKVAALYEAIGATKTMEQQPMPSSHNLGTARMSANPRDGVTNRWGQSHDIPNLFVSDGSLFTTASAANPTLTIVTLAVRQAEYIAEQMRTHTI